MGELVGSHPFDFAKLGLCFSWAVVWVHSVVSGVLYHPGATGGASGAQAWVPLASTQWGGSFRGACWGRVLLEQTPLGGVLFPEVAPTFRVTTHHGSPAKWPTGPGCACHAVFLVLGPCWPGTSEAVAGAPVIDWVPKF